MFENARLDDIIKGECGQEGRCVGKGMGKIGEGDLRVNAS